MGRKKKPAVIRLFDRSNKRKPTLERNVRLGLQSGDERWQGTLAEDQGMPVDEEYPAILAEIKRLHMRLDRVDKIEWQLDRIERQTRPLMPGSQAHAQLPYTAKPSLRHGSAAFERLVYVSPPVSDVSDQLSTALRSGRASPEGRLLPPRPHSVSPAHEAKPLALGYHQPTQNDVKYNHFIGELPAGALATSNEPAATRGWREKVSPADSER